MLRLAVVGLLLLGLLAAALLLVGGGQRRLRAAVRHQYRGGPERTPSCLARDPSGTPRVEWSVGVKGPVGAWSPAVQDGMVYIGDQSGFVSAIDERTRRDRWQHDVGAPSTAA